MIKELLNVSRERVKNPFVASFLISLIMLNWRPILFILFSSMPMEERIAFSDAYYISVWNYFWWPLFLALFYSIVLPYVMMLINHLLKTANRTKIESYYAQEINRTKQKALLVAEEVKLERIKLDSRDLARATEDNENLKKLVEQKEEMIRELQNSYNNLKVSHEKLMNDEITRLEANDLDINSFFGSERNDELLSVFEDVASIIAQGNPQIPKDFFRAHQEILLSIEEKGLISLVRSNIGPNKAYLTKKGGILYERMMEKNFDARNARW